MFKIPFTLKQHTPIIHFQHDQEGAILRATELKPKLDRFLIEKYGGLNRVKENNPTWFSSIQKNDSLDYKISIVAEGGLSKYAISSNPASGARDEMRSLSLNNNLGAEYINRTQFFADNQFIDKESQHNQIRQGVLYEKVKISIDSFNTQLLEKLQKAFPEFIISENFGTRQSKGFGCFTVSGTKDEDIVKMLKDAPNVTGIFRQSNNRSFQEKLQSIADHYSRLKRGYSFRNEYEKSKLWTYLCAGSEIKWEKRKIKLHIKSNDPLLFEQLKFSSSNHRIENCNSNADNLDEKYFYVRALLGLAENYEFVLENNSRLKVKMKDKSPEKFAIDRFRSPIRYFLTETGVFLITEQLNPLLQKYQSDDGTFHPREFEFTIDTMKGNKAFSLQVPQNFDLPDFITKAANFGKNLKQ